MQVALLTTFAGMKKEPLSVLLERIHGAFLGSELGEPPPLFKLVIDAPDGDILSSRAVRTLSAANLSSRNLVAQKVSGASLLDVELPRDEHLQCAPHQHEKPRPYWTNDRSHSRSSTALQSTIDTSSSPSRAGLPMTSISVILPFEILKVSALVNRPRGATTTPIAPSTSAGCVSRAMCP